MSFGLSGGLAPTKSPEFHACRTCSDDVSLLKTHPPKDAASGRDHTTAQQLRAAIADIELRAKSGRFLRMVG
jgi:hypothetical protein